MKKIIFSISLLASLAFSAQTITFNGDSVTDNEAWADADNWDLDIIPTATHDVVVPDGFTVKIKSPGALANSITANGSGKVQINAENSLTVTGNLTYGTSNNIFFVTATGKNMGTLIFGGTASNSNTSAKIRLPNNNKWNLISSPFKQARIDKLISDATTIRTNGTKYSLATFNDANADGAKYTYFTTAIDGSTDKLGKGQGYAMSVNNTTDATKPDIQFKGKFNVGDVSSPTLVHAGDGFVLLGNPFTAYVHANVNADATKNLLTVNSGKLDEQTIWLWDSGTDTFVTKNQSSDALNIAPGQGYFVKVKSGVTGTFKTNNDMQTHTKTDGFFKVSDNKFEIDLSIKRGKLSNSSSLKYIENTSTSFDNGYDSSLFTGLGNSFTVYTQLVDYSDNKKLAIQSLPNSDFDSMVIPVGVIADAGEISFSVNVSNLPKEQKIFLEDRLNNTFTRLDQANTSHKVVVEAGNTEGRFFLHTKTSSVLSVDTDVLSSVNIYKTSNTNLRVTGLQKGNTTVTLYNLLGKQVLATSFGGTTTNNISLPKLASGVYLVKLETEKGALNKKIILE